MVELKIENVSFYYKESTDSIVENCSISFNQGSIIGLVGQNGSGKSTFLKLLAGILRTKMGTIDIENTRINNIRSSKKYITLIPENAKLFLIGTTVLGEFVNYFNSREEIINVLNDFSLEKLLDKKIYELSEGQRRLVAIVSAFQQNKDIFLLDEPTIGLDSFGRKILNELLQSAKKEGKIVIVATNDNRILPDVDRIIGLKNGKFVIDGSPEDVLLQLEEKLEVFPNQISRLVTNLQKQNRLIPNITKVQELNDYLKSMEK